MLQRMKHATTTTTAKKTAASLTFPGKPYCPNTTAANALAFELDGVTVWFSYETPIAFQAIGHESVVRVNAWGPTTAKHLRAIDGGTRTAKADRVPGDDFERMLSAALANGEES